MNFTEDQLIIRQLEAWQDAAYEWLRGVDWCCPTRRNQIREELLPQEDENHSDDCRLLALMKEIPYL